MRKYSSIVIATGIFPPDIGGPASYGSFLADRLAQDGVSVTVITYSDSPSSKKDNERKYKVVRVWRSIPWGLRHIVYLLKLISLAKKSDLIYALNAVSAGVPARIASSMSGKKFIVRIAGDAAWEAAANSKKTSLLINDYQGEKRTGKFASLHKNQVKTCRLAKIVITPSNFLASIVKGWGIDENKIKVIYNGVDEIKLTQSKEEARKKLGIPGIIILSYGRVVSWKGFKMLVKIMPKLLEINQFFRLVVVGDGPELKQLKSMTSNMGLDRKVYIVGRKNREELATYLAAADIFILNTGYEGFSHQVLEAMSAGIPVITTPVGGNLEIMRQGENGFMVKYNDEFNLIEAVRTLWLNPELRQEFVEEGKKSVLNYSSDKMYRETFKALET